jgi:DNA-binding response OmpR family regulator
MPAEPTDQPIRALVVEDDPGTAEFVRIGLSYEGFDVTVCGDGAAAVREATELRPTVVVLDWMLPGMDGLEVCRRLRAQSDAAILMLTARDALADRVQGLETGADDYLVKPFHYEELVARIRAVLRRRETRAQTSSWRWVILSLARVSETTPGNSTSGIFIRSRNASIAAQTPTIPRPCQMRGSSVRRSSGPARTTSERGTPGRVRGRAS